MENIELVEWNGYENQRNGRDKQIYSIKLTKSKFDLLWKELRKFKGSQEEFYFKHINPMAIKKEIELKTSSHRRR